MEPPECLEKAAADTKLDACSRIARRKARAIMCTDSEDQSTKSLAVEERGYYRTQLAEDESRIARSKSSRIWAILEKIWLY